MYKMREENSSLRLRKTTTLKYKLKSLNLLSKTGLENKSQRTTVIKMFFYKKKTTELYASF